MSATAAGPLELAYISSSSFSGSTLLAFLLNAHRDIATVGEMDGWRYAADRTFQCSCGRILRECRFFQRMAEAYAAEQLHFDPRDFGTAYRLHGNDRLNRYLTDSPPVVRSSALESLRDALLLHLPFTAPRLARQDRSSLVFIRAALQYRGARVFVDACKTPYRLRHLARLSGVRIRVVHLVRDPRGVALSNITKRGWNARVAARVWLREQADIVRIGGEFAPVLRVYYEDLCDRTRETLAGIHRFLNLPALDPPSDYMSIEHHILGNFMRLRGDGTITKDTRWTTELRAAQLDEIRRSLTAFQGQRPGHPLTDIIAHYFTEVSSPSAGSHQVATDGNGGRATEGLGRASHS
jgi:hypothetical protein